jgi:nitrite reductase/ring-hydroxylating ferredoxin subunit
MNKPVLIGKLDEIREGDVKAFKVEGKEIAVIRFEGDVYAMDNCCTHEDCELSDGIVEDHCIMCPCHGARFDLKTGEVMTPPADKPVKCYDVNILDGNIFIQF